MLCSAPVVGATGVLNPPPSSSSDVRGVLHGVDWAKASAVLLDGLRGLVGGRRGSRRGGVEVGGAWFVEVTLMSVEGAVTSSPADGTAGTDVCDGRIDVSMLCWCLCRVVSYVCLNFEGVMASFAVGNDAGCLLVFSRRQRKKAMPGPRSSKRPGLTCMCVCGGCRCRDIYA